LISWNVSSLFWKMSMNKNMGKLMTKTKLTAQVALGILMLVGWLSFAIAPAYAGDNECRRSHNECGHDDGDDQGGQAQSESEAIATAESTATADSSSYSEGGEGGAGGEGGTAISEGGSVGDTTATGGEGGSVGDININSGDTIPADTTHYEKQDIRVENTPDIVTITPGSGDTCKAHIGFGASVPGIGTNLNIPLPGKECRKLKAYDRAVAMDQWQAAEIMFCSLKEVKTEFRTFGLNCVDILTLYVPIDTTGQITITADEYDGLLVAQVQKEEFEDAVEQAEMRYSQQQSLIDALQEEVSDNEIDQQELERIKREAAIIRAKQEAEEKQQADVRAQFKRRLDAREIKGEEKGTDE
jgi:hypothetical protein